MQILPTAAGLQAYTEQARQAGKRLGLVPTMGALHDGHLQLVQAARAECDEVIVSLFVNPTQFNSAEDFRLYPRVPEADAALLEPVGCTALFVPSVPEVYPQPAVLRFDFGPLERVMEGAHRPGHFNGVATVVSKLFHLARPHRAYFGQKDWQQVAVIRQLVRLSFDLENNCPTIQVRQMAVSSRNRRLGTLARHAPAGAEAPPPGPGRPPAMGHASGAREPLFTRNFEWPTLNPAAADRIHARPGRGAVLGRPPGRRPAD
jgi:pantoate--beta-alanine ligase